MTPDEMLRSSLRHLARSPTKLDPADYRARCRAAGIGPGTLMPDDVDGVRRLFARANYMLVNAWNGCREGPCRRRRGCMAPSGICTNLPRLPPIPAGPEWNALVPTLERALEQRLDAFGAYETETMGWRGAAGDADPPRRGG